MSIEERVNQFINDWLAEAWGLPITLSISKLGLAAISMLESALADEREACAQLVESLAGLDPDNIAAQIRSRTLQVVQMDESSDPEDSQDNEIDYHVDFGPCCYCGMTGLTVHNLIMLDKKAKTPGLGCWGCLECGLPMEGAVAVLCDECVDLFRFPIFAIDGDPQLARRIPIGDLTEDFRHDMSKHPEAADGDPFEDEPLFIDSGRVCRVCGCTDLHACEGGCYWVEADLCSRCADLESA